VTRIHARSPLSAPEASSLARSVQSRGGTVVFTNGVFDLLHPGHVRYLQEARALGDALIVAINSDRSVRTIKGPERPINAQQERAEVLLALGCVDGAVIFDEETPYEIVSAIQPDILVKGADWGADAIVGRDIVEARGGRVVRIALAPGFSTTDLIGRVRSRYTACDNDTTHPGAAPGRGVCTYVFVRGVRLKPDTTAARICRPPLHH
jgi:rfaE bifunctional protein nucleotidyltransferase chain/domain